MDTLQVMNKIKSVITRDYATYKDVDDSFVMKTNTVLLEPCDDDRMNDSVNVFIEPMGSSIVEDIVDEDEVTDTFGLTIIVKRGKNSDLQSQCMHVKNAVYRLLRRNNTLDGTVDNVSITSWNYFPQLYTDYGVVGLDMNLSVSYYTDF